MPKNKYERARGIETKVNTRNLEKTEVYIHELKNIRKEIKRGIPLSWGLRLFWSIFCLCMGDILSAALTTDKFSLVTYVGNLSPFIQTVLCVSFLGSILLLIVSRSYNSGSALEQIDQILEQCGEVKSASTKWVYNLEDILEITEKLSKHLK